MDNTGALRTCKKCGQIKQHILKKIFADGSKYYTDEHGKKWLGSTGPCCTNKARKEYYAPVEHKPSVCEVCKKEFVQKTSNQLYCSKACSKKKHNSAPRTRTVAKLGDE